MNEGKAVGALLALTSLLCAVPRAASADDDRPRTGAVVVYASGSHDDGIGAGTIVARGRTTVRVITAKHLAVFGTLSVRFPDGSAAPAKIVDLIAGRDLAILEADAPAAVVASLRVAAVRQPQSAGFVHVYGSGHDGPAREAGVIGAVGAELPDGPARGRFAMTCRLCHEGDSGGGVFDRDGNLVGVFVGYFTVGPARISIAEIPNSAVRTAYERPFASVAVATSVEAPAAGHASTALLETTNESR